MSRSAASRRRAWGASTDTTAWRPIWRPRAFGPRFRGSRGPAGLGSRIHARFAAIGGAELEVPPRRELPRAAAWESADLAEAGLHHDKTAASCIRVTDMSAPAPTPGTLVITSAIENGAVSIALSGELDLAGARQLEMRLDEAERESPE